MQNIRKHLTLFAFIAVCAVSLIQYIPYHIFFSSSDANLGYIAAKLSVAYEFILPPFVALVALAVYSRRSAGRVIGSIAIISLGRAMYFLPFGYMSAFSAGYDSVDSLLLSVAELSGSYFSFGVFSLALFCIALLVIGKMYGKSNLPASVSHALSGNGIFDFSDIGVRTVFILVAIAFALNMPYADVIGFIADFGSSFTAEEIFSIILDILYRPLLLFISHVLLAWLRRIIV